MPPVKTEWPAWFRIVWGVALTALAAYAAAKGSGELATVAAGVATAGTMVGLNPPSPGWVQIKNQMVALAVAVVAVVLNVLLTSETINLDDDVTPFVVAAIAALGLFVAQPFARPARDAGDRVGPAPA